MSGLADLSDLSDLSEDLEDLVLPQFPGFEIEEAWPILALAGGGGLILLALLASGGDSVDGGDGGGGGNDGAPANRAPASAESAPATLTAMEGLAADWDVMTWFSDPDAGDSLTLEVSGLPDGDWLTWESDTSMLAIAADATDDAQVGTYTLEVTATDEADATAVHTATLTVENTPEAPTTTTLAPTTPFTVMEGAAADLGSVATWFSDPDAGDSLTFEVSGLPDGGWLTWDEATNRLAIAAGVTNDAHVGMYTLAVTASDTTSPTALTAVHTVVLTVENTPVDEHPRREHPRREHSRGPDDDDACSGDGDGGRGCYGRLGCHDLVLGS